MAVIAFGSVKEIQPRGGQGACLWLPLAGGRGHRNFYASQKLERFFQSQNVQSPLRDSLSIIPV
jgi:hypothetical protein